MNYIHYIIRFIIRNLKWYIIGLFLTGIIAYILTRNLSRSYEVSTTIYTGFTSGFTIESNLNSNADYFAASNATDNLINIIKSRSTLERVSLRLFAQSMMFGNPNQDNKYITAKSYRSLKAMVPDNIKAIIHQKSVDSTVNRLQQILHSDQANFVFELLNWYHKHYSIKALSKINVYRINSSDMLEINYTSDDKAICYQTILLLSEELANKYRELQFSETNNVVAYFEKELARAKDTLTVAEDRLMIFNKENRIINYEEQTKSIASLFEKVELQYQQVLMSQSGANTASSDLEIKLGERTKLLNENALLVDGLRKVQNLTSTITRAETFLSDSLKSKKILEKIKEERLLSEEALNDIATKVDQYNSTKAGIIPENILQQWLFEAITLGKANSQRSVLDSIRGEMDSLFTFYSPIGASLKRIEREINVAEQAYLSLLHSLSLAKLKQKNLTLTSASLRAVASPVFPLDSKPTKRKIIIALTIIASFIFISAYLLIIEFLNSTLRDPFRTTRLTKTQVLGVIPWLTILKKDHQETIRNAAAQLLINNLLEQIQTDATRCINIFSNKHQEGKTFICQILQQELIKRGYNVIYLQPGIDFQTNNKQYDLAEYPVDLLQEPIEQTPDFFIVEYPILTENNIPTGMLKKGHLNLMICDARKGWAEADQNILQRLKEQIDQPLYIYLNYTAQIILEDYVGLLPPYTLLRKILYKIYNLEFNKN